MRYLTPGSQLLGVVCLHTAEDGFKCYAVHAVRLSTEAEQCLIGARSELVGDNRKRSDGVFVYKRRGESEARVLVVEVKYAAEVSPPQSDEKSAEDAVYQALKRLRDNSQDLCRDRDWRGG